MTAVASLYMAEAGLLAGLELVVRLVSRVTSLYARRMGVTMKKRMKM